VSISVEFDSETREALREALEDMERPVDIHVFVGDNCKYCDATVKLVEGIAEESPRMDGEPLLRVHVHRKGVDDDVFQEHGVYRVPSVTLLDGVIKYTGIPAGEEVRGLVETIIRVSTDDPGLDDSTSEKLRGLVEDTYIENIVTPQCPYCPYAALLINMFAFEVWRAGRRNLVADTIEAYENPDIADKYNVTSVPAIAVNGNLLFIGVPYEEDLIERIIAVVRRHEKVSAELIADSATKM
jgi:glutaredoxin-like protein